MKYRIENDNSLGSKFGQIQRARPWDVWRSTIFRKKVKGAHREPKY